MTRIVLIAVAVTLSACISDQSMKTGLARNSESEIGCPADQIEVLKWQTTSSTSPTITWTATCRGKVFLCKEQLINGSSPLESRTEKSCKPSPM